MEEYIKKSEALSKANYYETGLTTGFEYVTTKDLNSLPTYHIPETATTGEYIRKADMERILYSTNNAVRIGELFTELPTYSFPSSSEEDKKIGDLTLFELKEKGFTVYISPSLTNI